MQISLPPLPSLFAHQPASERACFVEQALPSAWSSEARPIPSSHRSQTRRHSPLIHIPNNRARPQIQNHSQQNRKQRHHQHRLLQPDRLESIPQHRRTSRIRRPPRHQIANPPGKQRTKPRSAKIHSHKVNRHRRSPHRRNHNILNRRINQPVVSAQRAI